MSVVPGVCPWVPRWIFRQTRRMSASFQSGRILVLQAAAVGLLMHHGYYTD